MHTFLPDLGTVWGVKKKSVESVYYIGNMGAIPGFADDPDLHDDRAWAQCA